MTVPEPPALPEELQRLLRRMRLPYLRRAAAEVCATARAQRWDPAEVLRVLLLEEVRGRDRAGSSSIERSPFLVFGGPNRSCWSWQRQQGRRHVHVARAYGCVDRRGGAERA